jgi:uncharacterized protein
MEEINPKIVIKEVEQIVEKVCADEKNVFGYGIWTHHIKQVVKIGKEYAKKFKADPEIVELAALLHDYAGIKDYSLHKEHHIHGVVEAEKILRNLNYPAEKIEAVKQCIAKHRGRTPGRRGTPEAECLANADAVAHIENVSSLFYLVYSKFNMQIDEGAEWIRRKMERTWKKLDPEIKIIVEKKYKAALNILTTKVDDEL